MLHKDVRRHRSVDSFPVQRDARFSAVDEPSEQSERQSIEIDEPGRLGNDGGARAVLEYGRET